MKPFLKRPTFIACILISICNYAPLQAQNTLGFSGTVAGGSAPTGSGPSTANQVITFHQSQAVAAPPGAVYTPTTTVTFSLSNQQFAAIEGNPAVAGMQFAGLGNSGVGAVGNNVTGTPFYAGFGTIFGGTYVGNYTGCNSCTVGNSSTVAVGDGVRYTTLGSLGLMLYTDALIQSNGTAIPSITDVDANGQPNLTGSFYYGDLTLTFNRPVSNPVLHIADIGGRVNYNTSIGATIANYVLGFTTDYKLITPGLSLSKLSGTTSLSVSADSVWNNASLFGSPSSGETYAGQARTSASGSIVILGSNITTVTFRLKLRGDGGAIRNSTGAAGAAGAASLGNFVQWAVQGSFQPCHGAGGCTPVAGLSLVSGDYIQYAVGLQRPVSVSGHLWHDVNAGNVDSSANIATVPHNTLYANLVDVNGKVVASQAIPTTPVSGAGFFQFDAVGEGTYTVSISTTPGVQGAVKPAESLPAGWQNTGEFNGAQNTGNDGNKDGISQPFTVTNTDVTNRNFAVQRGPESAFNLQPAVGNPGGFNNQAVPAGAFQLNNVGVTPNTQDYDGGTVTNIRITAFPANANSITINGTIYTNGGSCAPAAVCTPWPVGGVTVPYTNGTGPSQAISVDPIEGNVDVVIPFASIDNAGSEDPTPGSITIPFRTISLAGKVWSDVNGNLIQDGSETVVNGTNAGGGTTTGAVLYANLVDASGKIIATTPVLSDGTYNFPNVPQNTAGLAVQVSQNQGVVGLNKPLTALPGDWVNTGENKNGQGGAADPAADGEISVTTTNINITNQDFGIERLPNSDTYTTLIPQPDVNTFVTLDGGANPPVLSGLDPEDCTGGCTLSTKSVIIDVVPANSELYYNGLLVVNGQLIANFNPSLLQVKMTAATVGATSTAFQYSYVDVAGKKDPTPATYTLTWRFPLPIILSSFSGLAGKCDAILQWKTAQEINADKFIIEQSSNGVHFSPVAEVKSANNVNGKAYKWSVAQQAGIMYYRLKLVDRDGKYVLSSILPMRTSCSGTNYISLYPNPVTSQLTVSFSTGYRGQASLVIANAVGQVVYKRNLQVLTAANTINLNMDMYAPGIYSLYLVDERGKKITETQKLFRH